MWPGFRGARREARQKGVNLRSVTPVCGIGLGALVIVGGTPSLVGAASGLNLFPDPAHVLLNLAIFLALVWPTKRLLLAPLLRVLEARAQRTVGTLERAEALLREAAKTRERFESRLAGVHAEAEARRSEILGEGEAQAREALQAARDEAARSIGAVREAISSELVQARQALRADAAALANEVAARILGRAL